MDFLITYFVMSDKIKMLLTKNTYHEILGANYYLYTYHLLFKMFPAKIWIKKYIAV